jgi:hypothetical protein
MVLVLLVSSGLISLCHISLLCIVGMNTNFSLIGGNEFHNPVIICGTLLSFDVRPNTCLKLFSSETFFLQTKPFIFFMVILKHQY